MQNEEILPVNLFFNQMKDKTMKASKSYNREILFRDLGIEIV